MTIQDVRVIVLDELGIVTDALGYELPDLSDQHCPIGDLPHFTSDLAEDVTADILNRLKAAPSTPCPFTIRRGGRLANLGECIQDFYIAARAV